MSSFRVVSEAIPSPSPCLFPLTMRAKHCFSVNDLLCQELNFIHLFFNSRTKKTFSAPRLNWSDILEASPRNSNVTLVLPMIFCAEFLTSGQKIPWQLLYQRPRYLVG